MIRPRLLFHGSTQRLERLVPQEATGVGPEHDRLAGVYAAADPRLAIPFALPLLAGADGSTLWTLEPNHGGEPRILIHCGSLDRHGIGFLYELDAAPFEPLDDWQWIARVPVVPVTIREVRAADYAHWVADR